jgi:hypothetical protein
LGSKVTTDGDSTSYVNNRISKARSAFASLRNIWKSTPISTNTKIRILKKTTLGVILYGTESQNPSSINYTLSKTRCLRRNLMIFWSNTILNKERHERTLTQPISFLTKERGWKWIGHVCRMEPSDIPTIAIHWIAPGKRKSGQPKQKWRRSVEKEIKE